MSSEEGPGATTALEMLGRYQLLTKLGQGGMGTVYLAHDTRLDRRVAIKVLPAQSVDDPDAVARFQREGKALAKLSHAGIVQAFDTEEDNGRHFLVMEFIEGKSLADILKEQGKISPTRATEYIHQAALALQHAHERGLVHRDLKPSNLLITAQGQVKLLDLGLARFLQDQITDPARTQEGMGLGTPDYAAPEQFRNAHSADARSDIYALGCTLYRLVTGYVPFPGSSLAEKYQAHQTKEPAAVEQLCPEAPGGLVVVIGRMMAKRPADRFQTAREVADALAPYVAGSSASFARIKSTTTWDRSQLTMREFKPRRRTLPWAVAGIAVAAMIVFATLAWPRLFPRPGPLPEGGDDSQAKGDDPNGTRADPNRDQPRAKDKGQKRPAVDDGRPPDDPDVLTVSKDTKDHAKYPTIGAALDKVKAGQTIRVLDAGSYAEYLSIKRSHYADITLEANSQAVLEAPGGGNVIEIEGVAGVTLRGFRLRRHNPGCFIHVKNTPGLVLDRLVLEGGTQGRNNGVEITEANLAAKDPPIVIRGCVWRKLFIAVGLLGVGDESYATPRPCNRITIRDNRFMDCGWSIMVKGRVQHIQIVSNCVVGSSLAALQLENLLEGTEDVLVANNTVFDSVLAFRLWDEKVRGQAVRLSNNLFLGRPNQLDMLFVDSGGRPDRARGPGKGASVHGPWTLSHNWRELADPEGLKRRDNGWITPGDKDEVQSAIKVKSRQAEDRDFLRPIKESALATEGAGKTDPILPTYVGAFPPEGVEPWDWDRTWRMPRNAKLLTVSKDPKDGGKFRTINAALAKAEPWATIRVLGKATYEETLELDLPRRHEGIWLVAPELATIRLPRSQQVAVRIADVPGVQVSGFRLRDTDRPPSAAAVFVSVSGKAAGTVLSGLDLEAVSLVRGVSLDNVEAAPDWPAKVRRCRLKMNNDGIVVAGLSAAGGTRGVRLTDNSILGATRGIFLTHTVADVFVAGNRFDNCSQAAIQLEDLEPASRGVIMANNTARKCAAGVRIWENRKARKHQPQQVEIAGNLLFGAQHGDVIYVIGNPGTLAPGDCDALAQTWRFRCNARDLAGSETSYILPLARDDKRLSRKDLDSLDKLRELRPAKGSPLCTEGLGRIDPLFPIYIGAIPPEGVERWDWDRTWRIRLKKAASKK
jgi:serine/threonine protein kinase